MMEGLQRDAGDVALYHQQVDPEHHQQTERQLAIEERRFESEDYNSSSTVSPSVLATRTDHDCTALRPAALSSPVPSSADSAVRSSSAHASPATGLSLVLLTDTHRCASWLATSKPYRAETFRSYPK